VVTFDDSMTARLNGETVTCFHVAPARTDGDVAPWFRDADALHTGDVLFKGVPQDRFLAMVVGGMRGESTPPTKH
jgi:glyoxylase-like metal-dependent hydrolase (beta-lactamase superfamily II)